MANKLIVLSGIPGTGKSTFARFLREKHAFGHIDIDTLSGSDPLLAELFGRSRVEFVLEVLTRHPEGAVIDWGFPPESRWVVEELRAAGARLIWFAGNYATARRNFVERGTVKEELFDIQLRKVKKERLPNSYPELQAVQAFSPQNEFRLHEDLYIEIFAPPAIV